MKDLNIKVPGKEHQWNEQNWQLLQASLPTFFSKQTLRGGSCTWTKRRRAGLRDADEAFEAIGRMDDPRFRVAKEWLGKPKWGVSVGPKEFGNGSDWQIFTERYYKCLTNIVESGASWKKKHQTAQPRCRWWPFAERSADSARCGMETQSFALVFGGSVKDLGVYSCSILDLWYLWPTK